MTSKRRNIISSRLFFGFCVTKLLILAVLKALQAIYPGSAIEVLPMFTAILLNASFILFLVTRVKKAGKDTAITGIPLAVFTTLPASAFAECKCLKTITFGTSMTSIGKNAFYHCYSLETATGGKTDMTVGEGNEALVAVKQ